MSGCGQTLQREPMKSTAGPRMYPGTIQDNEIHDGYIPLCSIVVVMVSVDRTGVPEGTGCRHLKWWHT